PTFLYSLGEAHIEDFPAPVTADKDVTLKRTFTIRDAKPAGDLCFRAAGGNKIEALADGWFTIDGAWEAKVPESTPRPRKAAGKDELLVPVPLRDGKGKFVVEYAW